MKHFQKFLTYTASIFTALSLVYAALCQLGVSAQPEFVVTVFRILVTALATAGYITLRDIITRDRFWLELVTGVVGCTVIVVALGSVLGWFEFGLASVATVFGVTVLVYFLVWLVSLIQSKRDADELNRLIENSRRGKK